MYAAVSKQWTPVKSLANIRLGMITFDSSERLNLEQAKQRLDKLSREYSAFDFRIAEYGE